MRDFWDRVRRGPFNSYHFHQSANSQGKGDLHHFFSFQNWTDLAVIILEQIFSNMMFPGTVRGT